MNPNSLEIIAAPPDDGPDSDGPDSLAGAVDLLAHLGSLLLQHGADAKYVEDGLKRLETGLGIERTDILVLMRAILITATRQNIRYTRIERIAVVNTNMSLLSEVEHLLRQSESGGMTAGQLAAELQRILALPPHYSPKMHLGAIGLGCAAFCHLFGGDWMAMGITGVAAATAAWVRNRLNRWQLNHFLVVLFTALVASLIAGSAIWLSQTPQSALTAAVLLLVPGASLINGGIDLLCGHILAGVARVAISVVTFLGIALGLGIVVQLLGIRL